jgi:ribosomal protein S18 acetylase RimI-like enzyme
MLRMAEVPDGFAARAAGGHQWWARLDESVVGFGNAQLLADEAGDRYGYLKDFYIVPEQRRQGHGVLAAPGL